MPAPLCPTQRAAEDGRRENICLRWSGSIESAAELLRGHAIPIVDDVQRKVAGA